MTTEWWMWIATAIVARFIMISCLRIDSPGDGDLTPHLPAAYARKRKKR